MKKNLFWNTAEYFLLGMGTGLLITSLLKGTQIDVDLAGIVLLLTAVGIRIIARGVSFQLPFRKKHQDLAGIDEFFQRRDEEVTEVKKKAGEGYQVSAVRVINKNNRHFQSHNRYLVKMKEAEVSSIHRCTPKKKKENG